MTTGDKAKGLSLLSHTCLCFFICGEQQGQNKLGKVANEGVCARQQGKYVWEKIYFENKTTACPRNLAFLTVTKVCPGMGEASNSGKRPLTQLQNKLQAS